MNKQSLATRCSKLGACWIGLFALTAHSYASDKPIGLVSGTSYGRSEVKSLVRNVLQRELPDAIYEECGEKLAPEDFHNYRLVILAGSNEESYTPEQSSVIEQYLKEGGKILLIGQAAKNIRVEDDGIDRASAYLLGRSFYAREGADCQVLAGNHKLLDGVFDESPTPFWLNGSVMLRSPDWECLIGATDKSGEIILVGVREIGSGKAYFVGSESFRMESQAKSNSVPLEDFNAWVRLLKNILSDS
jgi:hypothetical protein